ncbi:MAG: carbon-monoxide dehydrogenase small subunit [Planctomycetota bacterium]|jgi:carbon-monoxide dehydrogenase small subunit
MKIRFVLNGEDVTVDTPPLSRFLDVVRDEFRLTATKEGCGEGECGSCSILVDGKVVNSCLLPAVQVAGCEVETLESVATPGGALSILQETMLTADGAQCGICTPGMIMAGTAYLRRLQAESGTCDAQGARIAIAGNLCRCTGYGKIIDAIMMASTEQCEGLRS